MCKAAFFDSLSMIPEHHLNLPLSVVNRKQMSIYTGCAFSRECSSGANDPLRQLKEETTIPASWPCVQWSILDQSWASRAWRSTPVQSFVTSTCCTIKFNAKLADTKTLRGIITFKVAHPTLLGLMHLFVTARPERGQMIVYRLSHLLLIRDSNTETKKGKKSVISKNIVWAVSPL